MKGDNWKVADDYNREGWRVLWTDSRLFLHLISFFFNIYLFIYLAAPYLSCSNQDLHCCLRDLLVAACRI